MLTSKRSHVTGVAPRLLFELLINSLDFSPSDRTNRARPINWAYGPINSSPGPCLSQYWKCRIVPTDTKQQRNPLWQTSVIVYSSFSCTKQVSWACRNHWWMV